MEPVVGFVSELAKHFTAQHVYKAAFDCIVSNINPALASYHDVGFEYLVHARLNIGVILSSGGVTQTHPVTATDLST